MNHQLPRRLNCWQSMIPWVTFARRPLGFTLECRRWTYWFDSFDHKFFGCSGAFVILQPRPRLFHVGQAVVMIGLVIIVGKSCDNDYSYDCGQDLITMIVADNSRWHFQYVNTTIVSMYFQRSKKNRVMSCQYFPIDVVSNSYQYLSPIISMSFW